MTPEQLAKASYVQKTNYVIDLLSMSLPSAQGQIITFIARRTCRFKKDREIIPLDHFEDGITNGKTGEWVIHGLRMTRKTIIKALKAVIDAGWLIRIETKTNSGQIANAYEFNWEKIAMAFLPKSKKEKVQRGGETTPLSSGETTPLGGVKTTLKGMIEPKNNKRIETPRKRGVVSDVKNQRGKNSEANTISSEGTIAEAIATGQRVTDNKMRQRAERPVSAKVLEDVWNLQMRQSWPSVRPTAWTGRLYGNAKNLVKEIGKTHVREFVEWSVQNWKLVKGAKFGPKRDVQMPELPEFKFFYAFRSSFKDVWEDREFMRKIAGNPKAGLIVWLRNQGYTEEDAIEEAGKREQHRERMDEIEAAKKEVEALHRQVGLVYAPDQGIRLHEQDAEDRIAQGQQRKRNRQAARDVNPGSELGERFRKVDSWDD